jgi:type I restriction enzyme S subunit
MVKEWTETPVKDLMKIETGSRNTEDKIDDGQYPFFVRSQTVERIDNFHYDCEAVLTAGDGVGTGKVFHYINGKFDAHQRVYVMSQFKNVLGKYFYYWFSQNFYAEVAKYTAKTSVDSVRRQMIAGMIMPIPSFPEQEKIVSVLSDVDALINDLQKLIRKKKDIRQGTMQMLLTGKKRLQGFSLEWKDTTLGKICDIKDGTHQTPHYVECGIPFYSVETVTNDDFTHVKYIALEEHERLTSSYKIDNGDVLMTRIGSIGRGKYVDWNPNASFYVSLALLKFRGNKPLANFIALLTGTEEFQKEAELHSLQFAIPMKINLGQISDIRVRIPIDEKEIKAIIAILNDMGSEIKRLEQKLNKYKYLKQGMMEELLTGKVRLI